MVGIRGEGSIYRLSCRMERMRMSWSTTTTAWWCLFILLAVVMTGAAAGSPAAEEEEDVAATQVAEARERDRVVGLPGQPDNVGFSHYAGYVTVNASHGRALFYWFFESFGHDPTSKPLLLWLNGGPGCSSVGSGAAEEIGPFRVRSDGASVSFNKHAWNKVANVLFVESPAGVGFSYSNNSADYHSIGDAQTALDAYAFLVGWFERFPQYKDNDFYIAGESYAGHYVPQLAHLITQRNDASHKSLQVQLKGILIGNPSVDDNLDSKGFVDFAWSHAIVSDSFYQNVSRACDIKMTNWSKDCISLLITLVIQKYRPINIHDIFTDVCVQSSLKGHLQKDLSMFFSKLGTTRSLRWEWRHRWAYPCSIDTLFHRGHEVACTKGVVPLVPQ